ncbi:extracellular solute-binding protein [Ilumatobacter sp.]|uniref:extracellular solute-binding protein n=1 Tax=Ilumatobacter sp. TaxID=1967498 RepID=UPI003B528F93
MKRSTNRSAACIAIAALALGATACGDDTETITLYSGRSDGLIQPIIDRFEEESGIDVEVKYGDTADLALLIDEEARAGRAEADVYLSQSPGAMGFLDGDLTQLPDDTLDLVDPATRDADGRWVGISGRQRVLVYNTDAVDPADLPDSVFDVVSDDRWSGQIGVAGGNGSFQDFITAMRFTEGEEVTEDFLADLAELDPVAYPNNNAIVAAVGRGEVEVGLVNHYYNFRALAEDPDQPSANHRFADGDPGSTLIVTAAAIVEGTDDPELADQLIEFLLDEEGQTYFANETFEYPLVPGVPTAGGVEEIEFSDVGSLDLDELEGGLERTRELIAAAGLET